MERLIMIYTVGDGFTYSAELTTPIVYESKKDALDDLHLILLGFEDKHNKYNEDRDDIHNKMQSLVMRITKAQKADKDLLKEKSGNNKSLSNLQKEYSLLSEKYRNLVMPSTFEFGGNDFEYSDFIHFEEEKIFIHLPNLYTVDEYFFYVEKNLENKKEIDNKNSSKLKI